MEINQIKLIMLSNYENQLDRLFNKEKLRKIDLIRQVNYLSNRSSFTRVDVKNNGNQNDIKFLEYGKDVVMSKPVWFKDQFGQGSKLEWEKQDNQFIVKCINEGSLNIILRGIDFRSINDLRVPIYTNFTKLTINNEVIFDENCLVWHDDPYIYEKNCHDQQFFQIGLEFKTLFDYFPNLKFQLLITDDIADYYNKIKKQIHLEKFFLNNEIILSDSYE